MQTREAVNERTGETVAPANNFSVLRLQREVGRSNFGAILVNRQGVGSLASRRLQPRVRSRSRLAGDDERKVFAFLARTDSPGSKGGSDHAGRAFYRTRTPCGMAAWGTRRWATGSIPKSGFCRGGRIDSSRAATSHILKRNGGRGFAAFTAQSTTRSIPTSRTARELARALALLRDPASNGGRFGYVFETQQDRPRNRSPCIRT